MTKVEWEKKSDKPKSEFLFIYPDSEVRLRILGEMPYEFSQHWFPSVKKMYKCAGFNCVACRNGNKSSIKYFMPVLAKFDTGSEGRVWPFGKMLFGSLKDLRFDPEYGDLRGFDFIVSKKASPLGMSRTEIRPHRRLEPLSKSDDEIAKKFMKIVDLDEMARPATSKDMLAALGQKAIFDK